MVRKRLFVLAAVTAWPVVSRAQSSDTSVNRLPPVSVSAPPDNSGPGALTEFDARRKRGAGRYTTGGECGTLVLWTRRR